MNRRRSLIALAAGAAVLLATQPAAAQALTLKMAHQWPRDESDYIVHTGTLFAKDVERRSNGQIKINIFPAESLVKAGATHTALKSGAVDLSVYPLIYSIQVSFQTESAPYFCTTAAFTAVTHAGSLFR